MILSDIRESPRAFGSIDCSLGYRMHCSAKPRKVYRHGAGHHHEMPVLISTCKIVCNALVQILRECFAQNDYLGVVLSNSHVEIIKFPTDMISNMREDAIINS